jgi:hypothetical protein
MAEASPGDLVQEGAETGSLDWVDGLDEGYFTLQMLPEAGMIFVVLGLGAQSDAVGQGCFQPVEVGTADIQMLVGDEAGEMLAHTLTHNPGLAMMHGEALFIKDGGSVDGEALEPSA